MVHTPCREHRRSLGPKHCIRHHQLSQVILYLVTPFPHYWTRTIDALLCEEIHSTSKRLPMPKEFQQVKATSLNIIKLKIINCYWLCNAALYHTPHCNDFASSVTWQLDSIVQNKLLSLKPLALWWVVFTECLGNSSRNSFSKSISCKKREEMLLVHIDLTNQRMVHWHVRWIDQSYSCGYT